MLATSSPWLGPLLAAAILRHAGVTAGAHHYKVKTGRAPHLVKVAGAGRAGHGEAACLGRHGGGVAASSSGSIAVPQNYSLTAVPVGKICFVYGFHGQ